MSEDMVTALLDAAHVAGQVVMRHRAAGVIAETKADKSVVTAADREAEAVILEVLARVAPGVPVVAEEESSAGPSAFSWSIRSTAPRSSCRAARTSPSTSR